MYFLALPRIRHEIKLKDPFEVPPRALTYRITKRMERLAVRKKRPEIPLRIPGAVSPAATKAIGNSTHLADTIIRYHSGVTILLLQFLRSIRSKKLSPSIRRKRPSRCRLYRFPAPILLHAIGCRK